MKRLMKRFVDRRKGTSATLNDHATAIRDLQQQVAHIWSLLARIEPMASDTHHAVELLPAEMRVAVDDLSVRNAILLDRIAELERVVRQLALVVDTADAANHP